jgi:serine/threonine protein phosphatase PrpC
MIWGRKQQPAEACCPHGTPREKHCVLCLIEAHQEKTNGRLAKQGLKIFEGEKAKDDFEYAWQLKKGEKREKTSRLGQDMYLVDEEKGLKAVFDGLGGEGDPDSGARASSLAAELLPELYIRVLEYFRTKITEKDIDIMLHDQIRLPKDHPQYTTRMRDGKKEFLAQPKEIQIAMLTMHRTIEELNPAIVVSGGQTTITAGVTVELPDGRAFEVIGQLGDSGVVEVSDDGTAIDVVPEDSLLDLLLTQGEITPEQIKDPNFIYQGKKEEIKGKSVSYLKKMTTQSLGDRDMIPMARIVVREFNPGKIFLYMSDGLRDEIIDDQGNLDVKRIGKITHDSKNSKTSLQKLNDEASKGPKQDDKIILRVSRKFKKISPKKINEEEEGVEKISPEEIEFIDQEKEDAA